MPAVITRRLKLLLGEGVAVLQEHVTERQNHTQQHYDAADYIGQSVRCLDMEFIPLWNIIRTECNTK